MAEVLNSKQNPTVFSTKKLTQAQTMKFKGGLYVESEDFIKTSPNRIPKAVLTATMKNVIITSKNAVDALLTNVGANELHFVDIYCVGRKTKRMVEERIGKVKHYEKSAKQLATYLVEYIEGTEVTYFCSNLRMDDLPAILSENNIRVNEVEAYRTKSTPKEVDQSVEGILFFSPSSVESYLERNTADKTAYCIGESTAKAARKHFQEVRVAKVPIVESVIDLVNANY